MKGEKEMTELKIKLKDSNGGTLNLGDNVRVLKITDDSGSATELFGVEPHLDGWVECVYIEEFEGVISFDEDKLMVVIKGKNKSIPLSDHIRYNLGEANFDRVPKEDLEGIVKDYSLQDGSYEAVVNYLVKTKKQDD